MRKNFLNFFLNENDIDESFFSISSYHLKKVKSFLENYDKQSKKILMLYGESGVGKTFFVHYLSNKYNLELYEINPSNYLNKKGIHSGLEQAIKQTSIFGNEKLIFIDELDNFSSRFDRGYLSEILKISKESKFPIIVTINDLYNTKLSKFRSKVEKVQVQNPNKLVLNKIVNKIQEKNNFKLSKEVIEFLIEKSQGDIRALTTDLFVFYSLDMNNEKIEDFEKFKEDFLQLSLRKRDKNVYESLKQIVKKDEKDFYEINNLDENWDNLELWIEENIFRLVKLIDSKIFYNILEYISTSDIFLKRIMRYQYWRYLVYVSYFMTSGINVNLYNKNLEYIIKKIKENFLDIKNQKLDKTKYSEIQIDKIEFPRYILEMSRTMRSRSLYNGIVQKIYENSHQSKQRIKENFRYYVRILRNDKNIRDNYEIDDIELNFLKEF